MEEERTFMELKGDDGEIIKVEHLLTFECNDEFYVAFLPCNEENPEEESDEVVIMRLEEDEKGDDLYVMIDDEEEIETAWEAFLNIYYEDEDNDESEGKKEEE